MSDLAIKNSSMMTPQNLQEALKFAELLAKSTIVPKEFMGNPGNILVAVQWGAELGLQPMQAMQNIAVINGRPSLWGDSVLALVLSSPSCADVVEFCEGEGMQKKAICIAKRHGREDKVSSFSMEDAKKANLIGKAGPWTQYPDRMLKMRARAWALRDQFADVLRGMSIAEEVMDMEPKDITPREPNQALLPAVQTVAVPSEELLQKARDAADKGTEAFRAIWKEASKDDRTVLSGELADLQSRCEKSDKQPTIVDTDFVAAMDKADAGNAE